LTQINFSPDGQFLVTGGGEPGALVWEAATGEFVMTLLGIRCGRSMPSSIPAGRSNPHQQPGWIHHRLGFSAQTGSCLIITSQKPDAFDDSPPGSI
jgi:hypothetical protein